MIFTRRWIMIAAFIHGVDGFGFGMPCMTFGLGFSLAFGFGLTPKAPELWLRLI